MKTRMRMFLLIAAVSLILTGCNKNTPKEVAHTWLTGFNHMDFEQSMKLSTPDTKNLLASLKELTDAVSDSGKTELKKITVKIVDVKEDGDKARVTYISSDNPGEQTLNLVKQHDKWLVLFTKVDLVGVVPEIEEAAEEQPATSDSSAIPDDALHQ